MKQCRQNPVRGWRQSGTPHGVGERLIRWNLFIRGSDEKLSEGLTYRLRDELNLAHSSPETYWLANFGRSFLDSSSHFFWPFYTWANWRFANLWSKEFLSSRTSSSQKLELLKTSGQWAGKITSPLLATLFCIWVEDGGEWEPEIPEKCFRHAFLARARQNTAN